MKNRKTLLLVCVLVVLVAVIVLIVPYVERFDEDMTGFAVSADGEAEPVAVRVSAKQYHYIVREYRAELDLTVDYSGLNDMKSVVFPKLRFLNDSNVLYGSCPQYSTSLNMSVPATVVCDDEFSGIVFTLGDSVLFVYAGDDAAGREALARIQSVCAVDERVGGYFRNTDAGK